MKRGVAKEEGGEEVFPSPLPDGHRADWGDGQRQSPTERGVIWGEGGMPCHPWLAS